MTTCARCGEELPRSHVHVDDEELVEAVARAIYGRIHSRHESTTQTFSLLGSSRRNIWLADARAVLAAIESSGTHVVAPVEPTQEMLYAGSAQVQAVMSPPLIDTADDDEAAKIIYGAMLSARPKVTE